MDAATKFEMMCAAMMGTDDNVESLSEPIHFDGYISGYGLVNVDGEVDGGTFYFTLQGDKGICYDAHVRSCYGDWKRIS